MSNTNSGFILRLRDSRSFKGASLCLVLNFLFEIVHPNLSLALTEGPSQPEVQSFEPIGTTDMVDLFTGDFNYNIPLLNLPGPNGGYPVNLAYHAGISMDDEASWTGLGWNINAGSLVRNMRGLPDEFQSQVHKDGDADSGFDYLEVKSDMQESWTLSATASAQAELFGANLDLGELDMLSISASIYYNNYKGVGFSRGATLGFAGNFAGGLSVDSENGLGISASLRMENQAGNTLNRHKLTLNFDGDLSLDYSLQRAKTKTVKLKDSYGNDVAASFTNHSQFGNSMSFARTSFSPSLQQKINSFNFSASLEFGADLFGGFAGGGFGLSFTTQDYDKTDKNGRKHLVEGYARSGYSLNKAYTRDFSRSNDGQITRATMFLPSSHFTYDTYASTGQGLSGYFRPRRSDVGRSYDPLTYNTSMGGAYTAELSPGSTVKFGVDIGANFGWSSQGPWDEENSLQLDFQNPKGFGGADENLYYQAHGEPTILDNEELGHIHGLDLPVIRLTNKHNDDVAGGKRTVNSATNPTYAAKRKPATREYGKARAVRNTLIHNLKNNEVEQLGEFKVRYYSDHHLIESQSPNTEFDRTSRLNRGNPVSIAAHPAGYKVQNESGSYYVYALPAYNLQETENLFSVKKPNNPSQQDVVDAPYLMGEGEYDYKIEGTHKFIRKTTKSPYAHSYLLTSVLGADYVDVTNDGPTDDDLGYWVKFDYVRYTDAYKWRAPYTGVQYSQNAVYTGDDDKGSYQYGEKEIWYLARIQTKSHIAVFNLSEREDNKQAVGEAIASGPQGLTGLKLDKIQLFEKKSYLAGDAIALQEVHFDYVYQLCGNSPNSNAETGKKLTLQSLYFTSNGSNRGQLNKYMFDYGNQPQHNPDYRRNAYDPWGTHKPIGANYEHHARFPYVNQFNQDWNAGLASGETSWTPPYANAYSDKASQDLTKSTQDALASSWCLRKITLPSGGSINIDYESDDYGYVQHKTANQMFRIAKLGDGMEPDEVYNGSSTDNFDAANTRRIYFKLEQPIRYTSEGTDATYGKEVYDRYVAPMIQDENGQRNLFFKSKMRLVGDVYDYVSGYLPLETYQTDMYGVSTPVALDADGDGTQETCYTEGFVTVQKTAKRTGGTYSQYHPMALAAWTYLQTDAQELLNNPNSLENTAPIKKAKDLLNVLADFIQALPATASNFGAIRPYCHSKNFARFISRSSSCIRLASPDQIKYGGGHRVREISITDNWSSDVSTEGSRTYGQHYDYTIQEGGRTISSGVAQYEPQAGGDENALKYPIHYFDKQTVLTNNNLFAEAPLNEALFPGASVGYRKVSIRSLHTRAQEKNALPESPTAPKGRTGGVMVHQFYTAKDFPTLVQHSLLSEENNTKDIFNLPVIIPLVGSVQRHYYHGTQAYRIELNDMHGRPKSVESFELNNYQLQANAISTASYEYQCKPIRYQGESVFTLDNFVEIIENGTHGIQSDNKKLMGVEYDLFTDQRQAKSFSNQGSFEANVDVPFIPVPTPWVTYSNHKSMLRTYVTNKVIHKTAILKKTKTRDLQTSNETEVIAYDEKSGQPLLTKIRNEFGDDFYNYNIPAYYAYDRIGHGYRNIGYNFVTTVRSIADANEKTFEFDITQDQIDHLVRGDELLLGAATLPENRRKKGYFLGFKYTTAGTPVKGILYVDQELSGLSGPWTEVSMEVIRSGRRNHYASVAANYLTKGAMPDSPSFAFTQAADNTPIYTRMISQNVLSATASLYKDDWLTSDVGDNPDLITIQNPFLTGNSGIWRPYKSYTYAGQRRQQSGFTNNNTSTNPKLYADGTMQNVPMFSWEIGNFEDYVSNWEWVNEVTRFSADAYETENVNRLGIYSSALYGYDNSLSIAVGGNAGYFELGTSDFETARRKTDPETNTYDESSWEAGESLKQTNLNFYNYGPILRAFYTSLHCNIYSATYDGPSNTLTVIADAYSYMEQLYRKEGKIFDRFGFTLNTTKNSVSEGNQDFYFNALKIGSTITRVEINNKSYVEMKFTPYLSSPTESFVLLKHNTQYTGKMSALMLRSYTNDINATSTQFVSTKAHTGKKSMKISGSAATVRYDQYKLFLAQNSYVLSMWISRDNTDVMTYQPAAGNALVRVGAMNSVGVFQEHSNVNYHYGQIVEGWQKLDVTMPGSFTGVLSIQFEPHGQALYVDDVRISPKTGGMTTYVYDPVKFWLKATLNADNYATLYFYDEAGSLTLKKQETEKGIFTLTESRRHVSEN